MAEGPALNDVVKNKETTATFLHLFLRIPLLNIDPGGDADCDAKQLLKLVVVFPLLALPQITFATYLFLSISFAEYNEEGEHCLGKVRFALSLNSIV